MISHAAYVLGSMWFTESQRCVYLIACGLLNLSGVCLWQQVAC